MWPFRKRCTSQSIAQYAVRSSTYERIVRCSRPYGHTGKHLRELNGQMTYESLVYQWTDEEAIT